MAARVIILNPVPTPRFFSRLMMVRKSNLLPRLKLRLFLMAVLFAVLFVALSAIGVSRSFLVEAQTSGAEIKFKDSGTAWYFPQATLCTLRDNPNPRTTSKPDALCAAGWYTETPPQELRLTWPENTRIDLRIDDDRAFVIEILTDAGLHSKGSLIIIRPEDWQGHAALAFRGAVVIGESMSSGARHYMTTGRWEARETGLAISLLRDSMETVKQGTFARGAQATVYVNDAPALMFGHITPNLTSSPWSPNADDAFYITMISESGKTELRLFHFGFAEPSVIRPDWIDSTLSSPLLLAAIVILTFLASLTQFLGDVSAQRRNRRE
ncbi:MAG: hypothetical protein AAF066_05105 [Pseudomonadota bacterium]